ncbi:HAMP domain-containing histidine kinase [Massilia sp. TS11]|nr:HAMP domain-containing histidine kinase [Massilia sp. TS11]
MEDDHSSHPDLFMFLASTAHDMKNSVSVLSGTLESLLGKADPAMQEAVPQMAHMLYQTKRLNDNLIQLLALYKQVGTPAYPFEVQPQEVGQLVQQVISAERVLLQSKGIQLALDVDPQQIWYFDEDLIIGLLCHALNNAINYTQDKIRLAIAEEDGYLVLRVEDNGRGYPPAMLAAGQAMLSGQRSGVNFRTNSTGLGLFFASEVARMHRAHGRTGSVSLENGGAYGGGCFILRLP